jgi:hypothetical protein
MQYLAEGTRMKRRPGRRKQVGSLDFTSGSMMWVLGYCSCCDGKVLADRETIEGLKLSISKTRKSLRYRLLMRIVKHYSDN